MPIAHTHVFTPRERDGRGPLALLHGRCVFQDSLGQLHDPLLGICPYDFQNLRASCATDWVERYPSHVVAKWLGHSPKVAAQHYLMSRDHHFEDVVKGTPSVPPVIAAEGPNGVTACDANCDAIATRNATPQAAAPASTQSHETTEPAATIKVAAGSSEVTPFIKTDEMAGAGFEPATSRL